MIKMKQTKNKLTMNVDQIIKSKDNERQFIKG